MVMEQAGGFCYFLATTQPGALPKERLDARLNTEAGSRPEKQLDGRLDTQPEAQPQKRLDA